MGTVLRDRKDQATTSLRGAGGHSVDLETIQPEGVLESVPLDDTEGKIGNWAGLAPFHYLARP